MAERRSRVTFAPMIAAAVLMAAVAAAYVAVPYFRGFPDGSPQTRGRVEAWLGREFAGQRTLGAEVRARFFPDRGRMHADTRIEVESAAAGRRDFFFLLNPGLAVTSASVEGFARISVSRYGGIVKLRLPHAVEPGDILSLRIVCEGGIETTSLQEARIAPGEILLPWLACWYPIDLTSFADFRCTATLPADLTVARAGDMDREPDTGAQATVSWQEPRPVLGASFVAGRYRRHSRSHGDVECHVFLPEDSPGEPGAYLDALSAAYNALRSVYDEDGFEASAAVVTPSVREPLNAGASLLLVPERAGGSPQELFMDMASPLARNWWGGSVSGRWLAERPEAAAWLNEGMAEYAAWTALRRGHGLPALLRYLESLQPPAAVPVPLKTIGLPGLGREPERYGPAVRMRGAFVAAMLAQQVGPEVFAQACRNVLRVHRHRTISLPVFRQELELVSEKDLGEFFRLWFDRTGVFDYALRGVEREQGGIRVDIEQRGDIPALEGLPIAVVTEAGVETHHASVGTRGGSFSFPVMAPVRAVILDPSLDTPDSARENNVWPRRSRPETFAPSPDGVLALAVNRRWPATGPDALRMFRPGTSEVEVIDPVSPLTSGPIWSTDGRHMAFTTDALFLWRPDRGATAVAGVRDSRLLAWRDSHLLAAQPSEHGWHLLEVSAEALTVKSARVTGPGPPAALVSHPAESVLAFSAPTAPGLWTLDMHAVEPALLSPTLRPVGNLACDADGRLLILDGAGTLFAAPWDAELRRWVTPDPLARLGHAVRDGALSRDGTWAAWRDATGRLRLMSVTEPVPSTIELPGRVLSYDWQGSAALVCLVAETAWALPTRCAADHTLWSIPTETKSPARIDAGDVLR